MSKPNFFNSFSPNQEPPISPFKISHLVLKCLKNGSPAHNEFHEFPHLKLKAFLPIPKEKTFFQCVSNEKMLLSKNIRSASPSPKHHRKHSDSLKNIKEEENKLREQLEALGNAIKKSFVCDKFTIDLSFKIMHQISRFY